MDQQLWYLLDHVRGSAAGVPYRGVDITTNASDGSLSYANISQPLWKPLSCFGLSFLGPSENNIIKILVCGL